VNALNGAPVLSVGKRSRRKAVERFEQMELLERLERVFPDNRDPICHGRVVRCEPSNGRKGWAPVKIEYDTALDLLNLEFVTDVPIHDSLEVDGVVIDYAKDKRMVAIEVLDAGVGRDAWWERAGEKKR
jgi:uncharacterized protein YuzE